MQKSITISTQSSIGFLTQQPMLARDFRKLLSNWLLLQPSALQELPNLPALFQRTSEGERLNSSSPFRFEAQPQMQWVHGVGPQAASLIEELSIFCTQHAHSLPAMLAAPKLVITPVCIAFDRPTPYTASQLIVAKNAQQFERWMGSDPEAKARRVSEVIQKAMSMQSATLGHTPPPELFAASTVNIHFEWSEPKLQTMQSKAYVRIVTASFNLPCEVTGSWAAGPLNNKGYGNISRA